MGFSNSDRIEEILYKCHELKIVDQVRDVVNKIVVHKKLSHNELCDLYEETFKKITKNLVGNKIWLNVS